MNIKKTGVFLYTMLSTVKVNLVGQLWLSEALVLLAAPFSVRPSDMKKYPYLKKILLALAALLLFQVLTDLVIVHNTPQNYLRGWAGTVIAAVSFVVLFKMLDDTQAILFFIFMTMIKYIIYTDDIVDSDMSWFKFKIAPILTMAVYLVVYYLYRRGEIRLVLFTLTVAALVCFTFDSRSTGVIFFLGALIIYLMNNGMHISRRKIIQYAVVAALLFQAGYMLYVRSVLDKDFGGDHARTQIGRLANPYNPLELLMTGRAETFAAGAAISDAPLFGHGSWAQDKTLKYYLILLMYHDEDMNMQAARETEHLVPSHSVLLGAWVNWGLGGFLAVLYLFVITVKMGFHIIRRGQDLALYPVLVLITIGLIWVYLFSPFQQLRLYIPGMTAIILNTYYGMVAEAAAEEAVIPSQMQAYGT
ncbi:O-antigen ligase family protein [Chitinophaga lutea]